MAEPDGITERGGSRTDDGNQTQTVLYRRTSDETVMASMRVTDQLILDGATASAHGRIASEQIIGPPQITLPGAHAERLDITDGTDNVIAATGASHGAVDDIPDMVREKMKSAKDIFVKTKAYENVYDALENVGHVLISGSPGSGKTTMALYIMGKYRRKKYNVKLIDDVAGFKVELYVNLKVPTLLVLDDVFGRFAPTSEVNVHCTKIFDYLETHFKCLEEQRKKTQDEDETKGDEVFGTPEISLKIIMSSRTNISKHQIVTTMLNKYKTSLFRQSTIAELTISELKEHEKESILRKHLVKSRLYLPGHDIKTITRLEYKTLGFPYICQLFADSFSSKDEAVKFFMEPWTYLYDLISNIFSSDDPNYRAAVLLLMVLNDGTLNLIQLQQARPSGRNIELRNKIAKVEEILPCTYHPNRLNEAAKNEIRTLLVSEGDMMSFSHPTIYDVVAFVVGDRNPDFILENCSLKFIIERTNVSEDYKAGDPSGGDMRSFIIYLRQDAAKRLVERLTREIVDGYIALPLSHQCFSRADMAEYLFTNLSLHGNIEQYLHSCDKQHGMGFLYWSSFSSTGPVSKMSFEHTKFSVHEIREGYLGCCMSGNLSSLRVLIENSKDILDKVASTDVGDIFGIKQETRQLVRSLSTACSPTKTEAPSDIETPRSHGDNKDKLIHIATAYGFTAIVELLLDRVGIHIDVRGGNDMTAIMYACHLGHKELAEILLQRQADPELLNEEGDNCLHLTCRGGSIAIAKLLLEKNMDVNKEGKVARTPLMYASYKGHGDLVSFLLKNGAKAEPDVSSMVQRENCLHLACVTGETGVVRILLEQGAMGIEVIGQRKRTPLMYACRHGRLETAKELVARNARANVLDEGNMNCLHLAAMKGHIPTAEWLLGLNVGLKIDCVNSDGRTPLMYASYKGHGDLVSFLLKNGAKAEPDVSSMVEKENCLHLACVTGETDVVRILLDQGTMGIEVIGRRKRTPLMYACKNGQLETAKEIVARNARANVLDEGNMNCLHLAAMKGHVPTAEWLLGLNVGLEVDCLCLDRRTPLMYAMRNGHTEMVDFLIEKGANIAFTDRRKFTCLHMATTSGIWHMLDICFQNSLEVNSLTEDGRTPVMMACKGGQVDLVKALVARGAKVNLRGGCLYIACTENRLEMVRYLVSNVKDVDINERGPKNRTAVMTACFHGYIDIVEYLLSCGADMTCKDEFEETCLHVACRKNTSLQLVEKMVKLLSIDDVDANGLTPLMYAVRSDSPDLIGCLVQNGANIHTKDSHGQTILHTACWYGNRNACAKLLDLGMDVDVLCSMKRTPLMSLAKNKKDRTVIAKLLVERGADINVRDRGDNTVLHVSANSSGHPAFARYMLERGVDVNTLDAYDQSPVMSACRSGNTLAFDLYLANGALLDLKNGHGASCLHLACKIDTDDTHIVNELLDRRVDINAQDAQNKTPAMYAISKGSVHILGVLLARNASLTAFDKRGNETSLLHYACNLQRIDTGKIELLLQKRGLCVNEPNMHYNQTPLMLAARQGNRAVVDLLLNSGADPRIVDRNGRNCVDHAQSQGYHKLAEYLADR